MSDDEDNLFGGGSSSDEDTDDLLANTENVKKTIAKKKAAAKPKKRLQKAKNIPDADNDSDDELFDSDDENDKPSKPKRLSKASSSSSNGKPKALTKREKMEALQAKRRAATTEASPSNEKRDRNKKNKSETTSSATAKGGDSGDEYDSDTFVRTKEDDDFVVFDDDDPDAADEYYKEQKFEDERPDGSDSEDDEGNKIRKNGRGKKRKAGSSGRGRGGMEGFKIKEGEVPDNPVLAAIQKMKRKKTVTKGFSELKEEGMAFMESMEECAKLDEAAIAAKRPALEKLKNLSRVVDFLTKREMVKPLLEGDVLVVIKRWIQPLPNGKLGNVTVRQKLIDAVEKMGTGEDGVQMSDLKRSDFGKVIMTLYMHKDETPKMKRDLKRLIEKYSREIFKKSGDMTELKSAHGYRREGGLTGIAREQAEDRQAMAREAASENPKAKQGKKKDFGSLVTNSTKSSLISTKGRVSVPYSKGFQYTVRPSNKSGDVSDQKNRGVKEGRKDLHKKIMERNRPSARGSSAGAGLSVEGRHVK